MEDIFVSDLGRIVTGKTPRTNISENYGGDIPFLTPTDNLTPKNCEKTLGTLTEKGLKEVKNCLLPAKSICVSCIGSDMGRVIMTTKETVTNQQFNSIIPSGQYDPDYIYYLMVKLGRDMKYKYGKSSTAVPIVSKSMFSQFKVSVLSDKSQQSLVAKLLTTIDDKISLNTRMNAELEAMAKQLYDYWFVQFDFPDENGKPYKSSGGKMVWNEKLKREIPEEWEVKKMEELLVFSNGINYDKNIEGDKQYRIINVRNITSSSIFINKETLDVINLPSKQADNYLVGEDDIIIARSGTPGSTRLIMSPSGIIYCGFIIKGTPKEKDNKYILMYYLKQLEGTQATKTGGSILQNVSQDTLKSLLIIVPPKDIVVSFNNHEKKLFNGINACVESTNYLTKLRDSLLPMLMNGQVTIE